MQGGRNPAIVSTVSATELLVRPIRAAAHATEHHILEFLREFPGIELAHVDLTVAREAARLRALHALQTADALIVACGTTRDAALVTNDASWSRVLALSRSVPPICQLRSFLSP